MKIELDHPSGRKGYYQQWKAGRILKHTGAKRRRTNIASAKGLLEEDTSRVILGAAGASSIDDLINGNFKRDRLSVVQKMINSTDDQLFVLPKCYRIGGWDVQRHISYEDGSLVRLDSMATKKQLPEYDHTNAWPGTFTSGFNYREMSEWNMNPERMLAAAFAGIKNDDPEKVRVGYAWKSPSDPGMHVVSLLHCVEGLEMRMMQDFAAWKILPQKFEGKSGKRIEQKLRNIERYKRFFGADDYLPKLELSKNDLIERMCRPHDYRRGWHVKVPNRKKPKEIHQIDIENMPIVKSYQKPIVGLRLSYSLVARDRGETEQPFREGRRRSPRWNDAPSKQDVYFTANAIAALHTVRKMHRYQPAGWKCGPMPIALPDATLVDLADTLRYRTVILENNKATGAPYFKALGKTEIEDWLWGAAQLYGARNLITTIPGTLSPKEVKRYVKFYEGGKCLNAA